MGSTILRQVTCPECGGKHYVVKNRMDDDCIECKAMICLDCGFDILGAYRAMQNKH